eukprot:305900-Amphidinium_carterae.1
MKCRSNSLFPPPEHWHDLDTCMAISKDVLVWFWQKWRKKANLHSNMPVVASDGRKAVQRAGLIGSSPSAMVAALRNKRASETQTDTCCSSCLNIGTSQMHRACCSLTVRVGNADFARIPAEFAEQTLRVSGRFKTWGLVTDLLLGARGLLAFIINGLSVCSGGHPLFAHCSMVGMSATPMPELKLVEVGLAQLAPRRNVPHCNHGPSSTQCEFSVELAVARSHPNHPVSHVIEVSQL